VSYRVVIVGLSGREFFLDRDGSITEAEKNARRFRSEGAAAGAGQGHLSDVERRYCIAVARGMSYRVETLA
jgi:hypothetical protein